MFKLIRKELDDALMRKPAIIYFAGIIVLCVVANIAVLAFRTIYGTNEGTYAYNVMEYAAWSFIVPYLTCMIIVHMVFWGSYPDPHIKDEDGGDVSRISIYLSKLISSVILAFIFLVITFVVLITTTAIFHMNDKTLGSEAIRTFCSKLVLALPLFLAGISFATMFMFIFEDKIKAYVSFYLLTLILPQGILFLAKDPPGIRFFKALRPFTISQCFRLIPFPSSPERSVPLIAGLGLLYSIIATAVGMFVYNRKK